MWKNNSQLAAIKCDFLESFLKDKYRQTLKTFNDMCAFDVHYLLTEATPLCRTLTQVQSHTATIN